MKYRNISQADNKDFDWLWSIDVYFVVFYPELIFFNVFFTENIVQSVVKFFSASMDASMAQKRWEMENNIEQVDSIFRYNAQKQREILSAKPWSKE